MDTGQILFYLGAAVIAVVVVRRWWLTRSIPSISARDAQDLVRSGQAVFIDVRTSDERSRGTIPGSVHVPLNELGRRWSTLEAMRGKQLIFFCATGSRSLAAAAHAHRRGLAVSNLSGGMGSWNMFMR